jgi:hypothetical protein
VAGRFFEDALWLLGPGALDAFDRLAGRTPEQTAVVLVGSGYAVARSRWTDDADYVCFDIGEQAAGMRRDAIPNSMHGHADCLSVVVSLAGRPVLVDSGLYAYNCGGAWEAHFRETAAHSTARIDGRDQAHHIGKMAWSHSYRATIEASMADDRQSWVVGSHDGYARGPAGVLHRRAVWLRPEGYLLVYDEFIGEGRHEIEVNYQFAPGDLEPLDGDAVLFDGNTELAWYGSGRWESDCRCGGVQPEDGWICGSLGVRTAAPRLTLRTSTTGPRTSLIAIVARRLVDGPRVSSQGDAGARLLTVRNEDSIDWITAAGLGRGGPLESDALVALCRIDGNGETERARIGGSRIDVDIATLTQLSRRSTVEQGR